MSCPDIIPTIAQAARDLSPMGLAYIHLAEADWEDAPQVPESFRKELRSIFPGPIIVAGGYGSERAQAMLETGWVDLVAFGRPFIANPDLPDRYQRNLPLASFDANNLFGGSASGYTDYPEWKV